MPYVKESLSVNSQVAYNYVKEMVGFNTKVGNGVTERVGFNTEVIATALNTTTSTHWSDGSKPPSSASALDTVVLENTTNRWGLQRQQCECG